MSRRPIRIALVSTLYPNRERPHHGVFVEERLRGLVESGAVEARVIAPVPWFFSRNSRFGDYARFASVPEHEVRYGISIEHPRYVVIPKIGMTLVPHTLARTITRALCRLRETGFDFDLIDSHYIYPDGVAATVAASRLKRPVVMTARGTDINLIATMTRPRRQIRRAIGNAGALVAVSRTLGNAMADTVGIARDRVAALRNGVDLERFAPLAHEPLRQRFSWHGPIWLCVGRLIENKGQHIALEALADVPEANLVLLGEGADEAALRARAQELGVADRVCFAGAVPHDKLPEYFSAADVLMHAAGSEGMPNVVLEALACGCAVIATPVGGIPEIMSGPPAGYLMAARDASSMLDCWRQLESSQMLDEPGRRARRRYAEQFGWEPTTRGQLAIFSRLTGIELDDESSAQTAAESP